MKIREIIRDDKGSAIIEFVVLGLLAQCLILTFGLGALQLQRQQLAVTLASRQAVRLMTQDVGAGGRLDSLSQDLESSFGLSEGTLTLTVRPENPEAGQMVSVTATIDATHSTSTMRMPR
ncbi:MAG: hypothetical protein RL508_1150 [Actinomycetota bacterium]|jgi:hypothetical protein